jgi:O-antigen ligase
METRDGIRIMGTGIFNDPNDLGMTLVLAIPFVLSRVSAPDTRVLARLGAFIVLVALLAACYYTNSRGTILAIGVTFTVFAYRRAGPYSATAVALVGLVGILVLAPSRMSEMSADEDSAQGRIQAWSEGLQMFKANPVFGVGFGGFADNHGLVAHNSFVHVLAELGMPGAVTFVGMFYWYFLGLGQKQHPTRGPDEARARLRRDLGDGALGMLICMFFLSRQYIAVPFAMLALGACYRKLTPPEARLGGDVEFDTTLLHVGIVGLLTLGMTILIYIIAVLFGDY